MVANADKYGGCFLKTAVLAIGMAALLCACDPQRIEKLEEGVATEADVRREFGTPEKIWDAPDGGRTFEYSRQPQGHSNYMITIAADGKMSALRQVLTPQNFAKVTPGMAMEDVRKMLGKPMKITPYELKREIAYDWRYMEPPSTSMVFTVYFNTDYRVLRTSWTPDPEASGNQSR
jgi:hypothetical protein